MVRILSSALRPLARLRAIGGKGALRPHPLDRALARARRPLDRAFESRATALTSIGALGREIDTLAWTQGHPVGRARGPAGPQARSAGHASGGRASRILIGSLRGWSTHNAYEIAIAHALGLRGAEVALLTCGGGMPACELGWPRRAWPRPCDRCAWLTDSVAEGSRLRTYRLREWLPWGADPRRAPLAATANDRSRQDAHVSAGWLLKSTRPDRVPYGPQLVDDLAIAAAGVEQATASILQDFAPDVVFLLNGLFAAERTIRRVALEHDVRAPTYEIAPRGGALVLSQHTPAPDYALGNLWTRVRDRPLSTDQRSQVIALLHDRARGIGAHESYYERMHEQPAELRRRLSLSGEERVVSLFTNVTWDSATLGHDVGFDSMFDWVEQTVRLVAGGDTILVVRIHPAERRWGTREQVREAIASRLGELPSNIRFVTAENPISSYALLDLSETVLTYTTTLGLEAAARGKCVAVCGDTHYRGRGFTVDVADRDALAHVLAERPTPLSATQTELALRYAHMFFFRAMIPFPTVGADNGRVLRFPRAAGLAPGADPYLDWICERILDGEDFGLPDELACASPSASPERCAS